MPRSAQTPLCTHLDGLIELLRTATPKALLDFDEDSIHKARVTTRRLKAAIELLETVVSKDAARPFSRLGRRLRRRLGPLRDLDVMLGHLDELKTTARTAPAIEWLRLKLLEQRERARKKAGRRFSPEKVLVRLQRWPNLREQIDQAGSSIDPLIAKSVHLQVGEFSGYADKLGEIDPHELRIAGKSLRYTLELAKAQGHKLPSGTLRTFKRMQEMLGEWHDFVVLAERAMKKCIDQDLPLHNTVLQRQVLGLIDLAMKRAQGQLDKFGKLWEEKGTELAQAIRDQFPVEQIVPEPSPSATESKTDPDPAPTPPPEAPAEAVEAPQPPA